MIDLTAADLEHLLAAPRLLVLKHSPRCGVSRWAVEELETLEGEALAPIVVLDVVADHPLARELAERTGVRHQSPQLLYFEDGELRWDLAHGAITADAVRRRLAGAPDRVEGARSVS